MKISSRKLKKAIKELYTEQQPEQMPYFLQQLRKEHPDRNNQTYRNLYFSAAKFAAPVMALLILGIITGYSYLSYRNAYQPYHQAENTEHETIAPTEEFIPVSESSMPESGTTAQRKQILHTQANRSTTSKPETTVTEMQSSENTININIIMTTIAEITDPTESSRESELSDTEQITISETQPESSIQTETKTVPETIPETQSSEQTLTIDEIRFLLEKEPHFSELDQEYDIYFDSIGDSIMSDLLSARSRIIPQIVFYFKKSSEQDPVLDSVKAPVSMILPEMIGHSVSDLENFLENIFLIQGDSISWAEDDSLRYIFYTSRKSDKLSADLNIKLEKSEKNIFSDYHAIYYFAALLQTEYFSLYHPEIENYYDSMTDQDYQKIENLFSLIKRHVPQDHAYYQEWLAAESGSVKSNHLVQDSHEIAMLYLEYVNYCILIDTLTHELEQQLPEEIFSQISTFNQKWSDQEAYFLEEIIPYQWDESHAEVVCFEAESAKCRSLILLLYLQDLT